jgi:hypothetical protein
MLSVVTSPIMLSVVMLKVVMLKVVRAECRCAGGSANVEHSSLLHLGT